MTIGVDRKAVSFNKAICAKMGIGPDSKIAFLVEMTADSWPSTCSTKNPRPVSV